MKATIYKQMHEKAILEIDVINIEDYMKIDCIECINGIFYITELDFFTCVCCRGTAKIWVNMC
ncbi:hypothetical protein D3C87_80980 [compost metagenome]